MLENATVRKLAALGALTWMAVIFWLSHQPDLSPPIDMPYSDKVSHFVAYGLLGSLFLLAMRWQNGYSLRQAFTAALLAALYGISDEWHQSFVPGRTPDAWDVAADATGALAAALLLRLATTHVGRIRPEGP